MKKLGRVSWQTRVACAIAAALLGCACNRSSAETRTADALTVRPSQGQTGAAAGASVKLDEATIRRIATSKPMPVYPAASLEKKTSGVAVAAILIAPDGRMRQVDVLQAPDPQIGEAVRDALMRWTISPVRIRDSSEASPVRSKATFYFRIVDGKGTVLSPDEKSDTAHGPEPDPDLLKQIDEAELARLQRTARPMIVDVRERADYRWKHREGAINIPADELVARARLELAAAKTIVLDCTYDRSLAPCRQAGQILLDAGFRNVVLLTPPR